METLIFVEELGRNDAVVLRHSIDKLPITIGRGYDADVMIDDPHVAARHLKISQSTDGGLSATDLASLNGTYQIGNAKPITQIDLHGNEILRMGKTQLRIRLPGVAVAEELPIPKLTWDRHHWVFIGAVVMLIGYIALDSFLKAITTDATDIFFMPTVVFSIVLVWVLIWSLVCRTLNGYANFMAHGIVAFLGVPIFLFGTTITEYLNFAFDMAEYGWVSWLCLVALFSVIPFLNLRLTARLSRRMAATIAMFFVVTVAGGLEAYHYVRDANKPGLQSFDTTIKPSVFLVVKGLTLDQFVENATHLKAKADKD
ncbi:MAG: FHA domain-containing protein [Gallionellaceae bacterium]|nr:FHA domain-containing protein [Gallionellaceae bacterium]